MLLFNTPQIIHVRSILIGKQTFRLVKDHCDDRFNSFQFNPFIFGLISNLPISRSFSEYTEYTTLVSLLQVI